MKNKYYKEIQNRFSRFRVELEEYLNKEATFLATFKTTVLGHNYTGNKVILLQDIYDYDGKYITDHMWIHHEDCFDNLEPDAIIKFNATCCEYFYPSKKPVMNLKLNKFNNLSVL